MKTSKLHFFPLQTTFLKKIQTGVEYYNDNHHTNFDFSSIEIMSFEDSPLNNHYPTDSIFTKALKTVSIPNPKNLTKLKITIQSSLLFNTSTIRQFGLNLARHFKTLKRLHLRFLSCKKLNEGNLRCLLDSLKDLKGLTEVNLDFLGCRDIDDQCLKDIKASILKRCKNLQIFRVTIEGHSLNRWDTGYLYFEPNLDARLQNYSFVAGIEDSREPNLTTSEGGRSFCRGIARYLQKLRSLTFRISAAQLEDHKKLIKSIFKMMAGLPNLKHLNFSLPCFFQINDKLLAEIFSNIGKNKKKLQTLSLDFENTDTMTKRGLQQLAQNLFSLLPSQLIYFALHVEHCDHITEDIIRKIGSNVAKNLKNLKTLILSFQNIHQLTDKTPSELTHAISKGLPSLKKLILSFCWFTKVNQTFPIVLPKQIEQFDLYSYDPKLLMVHKTWQKLTRLSLSFCGCWQNTSFEDLFSEPSLTFKNLTELRLIYAKSKKVEDKHIRSLAIQIGTKLENLTSLEFEFPDCPLLNSDSLLFLSDEVCKSLKKLRHLGICLISSDEYDHSSLLEGGVLYLTSTIASRLEHLESLTLSFHGLMDEKTNMERMLKELCSLISGENLKKLKKLTLIFRLFEDLDLKHLIREKLRHIPMLYIH